MKLSSLWSTCILLSICLAHLFKKATFSDWSRCLSQAVEVIIHLAVWSWFEWEQAGSSPGAPGADAAHLGCVGKVDKCSRSVWQQWHTGVGSQRVLHNWNREDHLFKWQVFTINNYVNSFIMLSMLLQCTFFPQLKLTDWIICLIVVHLVDKYRKSVSFKDF